jgi:hypothetical protein
VPSTRSLAGTQGSSFDTAKGRLILRPLSHSGKGQHG